MWLVNQSLTNLVWEFVGNPPRQNHYVVDHYFLNHHYQNDVHTQLIHRLEYKYIGSERARGEVNLVIRNEVEPSSLVNKYCQFN